jgi:hypothetical protein
MSTRQKLTATEQRVLARMLASWATTTAPDWSIRPGESFDELRALAVKLGILEQFEFAVVQYRTEQAGGNANEGLLQ